MLTRLLLISTALVIALQGSFGSLLDHRSCSCGLVEPDRLSDESVELVPFAHVTRDDVREILLTEPQACPVARDVIQSSSGDPPQCGPSAPHAARYSQLNVKLQV